MVERKEICLNEGKEIKKIGKIVIETDNWDNEITTEMKKQKK